MCIDNSFIRINSLNRKSISCYAPPKYQKIENIDHFLSCQSRKVRDYFNNDFNNTELVNQCLDKYEHMFFKGQYLLPDPCKKIQRPDVYSFKQNGFSIENFEKYFDMTRFSSLLNLKDGEYFYEDRSIPNRGYLIASTAPIGNPEHVMNSTEFRRDCGDLITSPFLRNKTCYTRNYKLDGEFGYDNTVFNFYDNLKFHKVDYVIMLTNFYEKGDFPEYPGCECVLKTDKYFDVNENGVFKIPKSDHYTNSGFTVTSLRNDEELLLFKDYIKNYGRNINDSIEFRQLIVRNEKGDILHKVTHIYFKDWAHHSTPQLESKKLYFSIVDYLKDKLIQNKNVLVHCTNGTGRTGTLIGSILLSDIQKSSKLNLFNMIIEMRKYRSRIIHHQNQIELLLETIAKTSFDNLNHKNLSKN